MRGDEESVRVMMVVPAGIATKSTLPCENQYDVSFQGKVCGKSRLYSVSTDTQGLNRLLEHNQSNGVLFRSLSMDKCMTTLSY
ncbi:hypothetical protein TRVA0_021S00408 [Trichomonascus vanleenenianus]|uniref:uncharacterized protein n=1 Tax=Trichomonascus vanleenenianus TaxID=2268995 RepID=UPI003ECB19B6